MLFCENFVRVLYIIYIMTLSFEQCSSLVEEQISRMTACDKVPAGLYEPMNYVLSAGGKRVRPTLALMACNVFVNNVEEALMPAVALEVFHNFTLLHDDLMDNADFRRNRPTVHKRWNNNTAILSGDAMMITAYQYLCRAKSGILPELLETFTRTALEVCEGQQYDLDFECRSDVSIDQYISMIRLKTAALMAACLKMGAICGGASSVNCESLYRFGISLGLIFQIQDDWLDVYADPVVFGKATGGDILCAKKTFLLITALEKADEKTRRKLIELLNDKSVAAAEKINEVKNIYDRLEVGKEARREINRHHAEAMSHLSRTIVPDKSRKAELELFAEIMLKREK